MNIRMKKGIKARPHDIAEVMKMEPKIVEIHASSEDLDKEITGHHNAQLAVHLPEYNGSTLMDLASLDEQKRLQAVTFYDKAISKSREWAQHFNGTPKVIVHPGGWSSDPNPKEKRFMYEAFSASVQGFNQHGIDFLVENMPPFPYFYGGQWNCNIFTNPKECLDQCMSHGYGFTLDICHAYLYCNHVNVKEIDIMKFLQIVRPIIGHIHLSDAEGVAGEGLQIGEGTMPIKEILQYIAPIQVGVVTEVWFSHRDNHRGIKIAWERLNKMLSENGGNGNGRVN